MMILEDKELGTATKIETIKNTCGKHETCEKAMLCSLINALKSREEKKSGER